jgi:uncharacterized protein
MVGMERAMRTVILLIFSNVFMTFAWYGHLKFKQQHLLVVVLASWLIALPEYLLQVPANRFGHGQFSAPQLKIIQEAISITVFIVFSVLYLREVPNWRSAVALILIFVAVVVAVSGPAQLKPPDNEIPSAQGPVEP